MSEDTAAEAIFAASDFVIEAVDVPWPVDVYVREMDGDAVTALAEMTSALPDDASDLDNSIVLLFLTICDADGVRFFTNADADIPRLRHRAASVIQKLIPAALRVNGMTGEHEGKSEGSP